MQKAETRPASSSCFFPSRRDISELLPRPQISPMAMDRTKTGEQMDTPATRFVSPVREMNQVSTML